MMRQLILTTWMSLMLTGTPAMASDPVVWFQGDGYSVGFSKDVLAVIPPDVCDVTLVSGPLSLPWPTKVQAASMDLKVSGIKCRFVTVIGTKVAWLVVGSVPYQVDLTGMQVTR